MMPTGSHHLCFVALLAALTSACGGKASPKRTGLPAPAAADGLTVVETNRKQMMECARHDLALRVVKAGAVRHEQLLSGECTGACTAEAKKAGETQVAEIEARIATGESSESELDYNFTDCVFHGARLARWETVGGHKLAVVTGEHPGPHDVPNTYHQLATELCGKPWVSQELGTTYANRFKADALAISAAGTEVIVSVQAGGKPFEIYRVSFPPDPCKDAPKETVGDAEEAANQ